MFIYDLNCHHYLRLFTYHLFIIPVFPLLTNYERHHGTCPFLHDGRLALSLWARVAQWRWTFAADCCPNLAVEFLHDVTLRFELQDG